MQFNILKRSIFDRIQALAARGGEGWIFEGAFRLTLRFGL